jgi:hypothetical protein
MIEEIAVNNYLKYNLITWNAIICGALIAFGLSFNFHLLTIGLGLTLFSSNSNLINEITMSGFIWTFLGGGLILLFAGWKVGKLIELSPFNIQHNDFRKDNYPYAMLHGFLSWVLYLMMSIIFSFLISEFSAIPFFRDSFINLSLGNSKIQSISSDIKIVGYDVLAVFIIFVFGSLCSSIGAYFGMRSRL